MTARARETWLVGMAVRVAPEWRARVVATCRVRELAGEEYRGAGGAPIDVRCFDELGTVALLGTTGGRVCVTFDRAPHGAWIDREHLAVATADDIFRSCQHAGSRDAWLGSLRACWQCGNAAIYTGRVLRRLELAALPKDCDRCGERPHTFTVAGFKLCGRCKTAAMREHSAAMARAGSLAIFATSLLVDTSTWAGRRAAGGEG